jgi:hypothetical protein
MKDRARDRFFDTLARIDVGTHIAGIEENVRAKIVVPLFEALGYDIIDDLYLEHRGVDLLVCCAGVNRLIVEVKTLIRYFRTKQVLSYSYNLECPWICVVGQDELLVYHALGLLQGKKTLPLFKSTVQELAQPRSFEELRSLIGKEAMLSGEGLLKSRVADILNLSPEDLATWHEQVESVARRMLEETPATQAMWEQLARWVPDIGKRLDEFVAGKSDLARGYPNDPYILKTSSPEDTDPLEEFGKILEEETGGRSKHFYRAVTRFGTLVMQPADE